MPINNSINKEERIIYSICTGVMRCEDFDFYIKKIWGDNEHYGFNELFSTIDADWSEFDFSYLFGLAQAAAKLETIDTNSKLAWVVLEGKQKELTDFYKSAKLFTHVKSRALEAFNSKCEAMQWLKE